MLLQANNFSVLPELVLVRRETNAQHAPINGLYFHPLIMGCLEGESEHRRSRESGVAYSVFLKDRKGQLLKSYSQETLVSVVILSSVILSSDTSCRRGWK